MSGNPGEYGAPVVEATQCYRHPGRETGVRCSRCGRPICPDCMVPASVGFQCPECVAAGRRSVRSARTMYGGRIRPGSAPGTVTKVLIAVNVIVFVITLATGAGVLTGAAGSSTIYDRFALIPVGVAHGQYYRLLTAMFLHYGIFHIGVNMYSLYIIGPTLETVLGRVRYVALYLLAGIGGGLLSTAFGPSFELGAGASGAIFGLLGGFYVIARHRRIPTGQILGLIAFNLIFSFALSSYIDWRAHVGGLVVGAVVAAVFAYSPSGASRTRVQAGGLAALMVVMAALGYLGVAHSQHKCPILTYQNGIPSQCFAPIR